MVRSFRFNKLQINSIINEENKHTSILTESQESKSIDAAKKLLMQRLNYSREQADEFIRIKLRNDFPVLRDKNTAKFIYGVTRMFLDGQIQDARTIGNLNTTLKYVASDAHINEYDRNLNGMSAQDLIQRFAKNVEMDVEKDRERINSMQFEGESQYDIVRIDSFEQSSQYGKYTDWCVTHYEDMFDSYTSNGINQFYFCLKKGFEKVLEKEGKNCPLDEYGLSMIAVSVNEKGVLNTCTCRWNHSNGGSDNIMDTEKISEVIGMRFYEVFKPNNKWNEMLENAMQRLRNGEDPRRVFGWCGSFKNGFAEVRLNRKWNWIDVEGNLLSPNQWFDECLRFTEGFALVQLNGKWNLMDAEGNLLSPNQWFDDCFNFYNGFGRVELNGEYNWIDSEGNLLFPNQWFDDCNAFEEGFAVVKLNGKWNWIDTKGNLLSPNQWFDDCFNFYNGFGKVELNGEYNWMDSEGNLLFPNQWFGYCGSFYGGFARIELNGKLNWIDTEGNLYDKETKEPLGINVKTMNGQNESVKFKNPTINESKGVQLNERTSSVVYHWCSPETAWKILQSNRFSLMSTLFKKAESRILGASFNRLYYMSMTRNGKIGMGGYSNNIHSWVRFTLDGDMLNTNFHIKAIDYWGKSMGKHSRMNGSRSANKQYIPKEGSETESEDRLYSSEPFIDDAISYIKHIDIFFDYENVKDDFRQRDIKYIYNICINLSNITTLYSSVNDFNKRRNAVDLSRFFEYARNDKSESEYYAKRIKEDSVPAKFLAACVYLVNFPYCSLEDCVLTLRQYGLGKYSKEVIKAFKKNSFVFLFDKNKWYEDDVLRVLDGWGWGGLFDCIQLANEAQSLNREDLAKGYQIVTDFCKKHRLSNFEDIENYFKDLVNNGDDGVVEIKNSHHTVGLACAQVNFDSTWYVCVDPSVDLYLNVFPRGKTQLRYLLDDIMSNVSYISHKSQNDKLFLNYIKRLLKNPTVQEVHDLCTKLKDLGYSDIDDEYYKPVISEFQFNYEDIRWGVLSDWGFDKDGLRFYLKDDTQKEKIIKKWNNS